VRVSELSQFYRSKLRPENIISRSSVFDTPFEQMSCAVRPDLGGDYVMMPK